MAILQRSPYLRRYLRFMASHPRLFPHSLSHSLPRHSSSLHSPPFPSTSPRIQRSLMSTTISTESFQESATSKGYSSEQIQVLEGMFVRRTGPLCLHQLVCDILDKAMDEAKAGYASMVDVILHADGSVSITDNGRGIPTVLHPVTIKLSLETVLTALEALEVMELRGGIKHQKTYSRGKPFTKLTRCALPGETTGTTIRFWPDKEVFTTGTELDHNTIAGRLMELAFLNPKVTICLKKEDADPEKNQKFTEYCYTGGLAEYVSLLNTDKNPIHDVLGFRKEINGVTIDIALQWCSDECSETMLGYANSIRTVDGGTHIKGAKASLTRTLNILAKKSKAVKEKNVNLSWEHVREGLTCIVSVKVPNPKFEGPTKARLGNPKVRKIVEESVQEYLTEYMELHPDVLEIIISKSLSAKMGCDRHFQVPWRVADCSSADPEESEIFIVEADSAGGSAKMGRDRRFQAVFSLRGKLLNVERRDDAASFKNKEIKDLTFALGLGVKGEDFKLEKLRYRKIIILKDLGAANAHFQTLLLTFLYKYQRALFDAGCIYVSVPPLFKVEMGQNTQYCYDDADLERTVNSFPANASYNIQRFKGLGQMMPQQLWETMLNPDSRRLKQLAVEDILATDWQRIRPSQILWVLRSISGKNSSELHDQFQSTKSRRVIRPKC